eukprot:6040107-Lingulodinium_polyedra.AAC.1
MDRSIDRYANCAAAHAYADRSNGRLIDRSIVRSTRSIDRSIHGTMNRRIDRSLGGTIYRSIDRSIDQSIV